MAVYQSIDLCVIHRSLSSAAFLPLSNRSSLYRAFYILALILKLWVFDIVMCPRPMFDADSVYILQTHFIQYSRVPVIRTPLI